MAPDEIVVRHTLLILVNCRIYDVVSYKRANGAVNENSDCNKYPFSGSLHNVVMVDKINLYQGKVIT